MQDPNKPIRLQFQANVQGGGPVAKFIAGVVGLAVIGVALFLSVFVFAGLLVVGVLAGGWFWWRTRKVRKQLRESIDAAAREALRQAEARTAANPASQGTVIEGDFIRAKPADPAQGSEPRR